MNDRALIFLTIMLVLTPVSAEINPKGKLDEQVLATAQKEWQIADSTLASATVTALGATERTFKLIQAAIVANQSNDGEISFVDVPTWANIAKFTAIGITNDGTYTANIRTCTLPEGVRTVKAIATGRPDANTTLIGTLAFIIGLQTSTRAEIAFTLGGAGTAREIVPGDLLTGNVNGATAIVESISTLTSGSWAGGDAAGTFTLIGVTGTFQSETLKVTDVKGVITAIGVTIGGSTTKYEMAQSVTVTSVDETSTWASAGTADSDRTCEAKIDLDGAKVIIVIPTACSANSKLLVKFY